MKSRGIISREERERKRERGFKGTNGREQIRDVDLKKGLVD